VHGHEGDPGVVVDGHEQRLPAGAVHPVAPVACDAVARPHDAPEPLGVDVQQTARGLVLVALQRLERPQVVQLGQARTREHPADGGLRDTDAAGDLSL
jgi:hypothetical protein